MTANEDGVHRWRSQPVQRLGWPPNRPSLGTRHAGYSALLRPPNLIGRMQYAHSLFALDELGKFYSEEHEQARSQTEII